MKVKWKLETGQVHSVVRHQSIDGQIGFSDHHPFVILIRNSSHCGDSFVNLRLVHGVRRSKRRAGDIPSRQSGVERIVAEFAVFEQVVNGVDPESIDPAATTRSENVEHGGSRREIRQFRSGCRFK